MSVDATAVVEKLKLIIGQMAVDLAIVSVERDEAVARLEELEGQEAQGEPS